jgi:hypothetical protein
MLLTQLEGVLKQPLDDMLKKPYPYHKTPVNHTLEQCDMLKKYYSCAVAKKGESKKDGGDGDAGGFPAVKNIFLIFGGSTVDMSNSQRKRERHKVLTAEKAPPSFLDWSEDAITFSREDHPNHIPNPGQYPLVVDPVIGNARFSKVLMDGGSSLNILYAHTLLLLGIELDQLRPNTTPFHGVAPDSLDQLDEARTMALMHSARYQQALRRYQARKIRRRDFNEGDLVLRLRQDNRGRTSYCPRGRDPTSWSRCSSPTLTSWPMRMVKNSPTLGTSSNYVASTLRKDFQVLFVVICAPNTPVGCTDVNFFELIKSKGDLAFPRKPSHPRGLLRGASPPPKKMGPFFATTRKHAKYVSNPSLGRIQAGHEWPSGKDARVRDSLRLREDTALLPCL